MIKSWGKYEIINLVDCDPNTIRDREHILSWGVELIDEIEMEAFGEPFIERFALHDPKVIGYSYFQAIETSNICAHFSESQNTVFINIFSCKDYDTKKAIDVCYKFFRFKSYHNKVLTMMQNGSIV